MRRHFSTGNGAAGIADFPQRLISLSRGGKHPRVKIAFVKCSGESVDL
jgi:hypothetical protein